MTKVLNSPSLGGKIRAIPSKSEAHRQLICAALSKSTVEIVCPQTSMDIEATARCLCAMGAEIEYINGVYKVTPITQPEEKAVLDCGESGSTLRFLLPVVCALGIEADFIMRGRLSQRPMTALTNELCAHSVQIWQEGEHLYTKGKAQGTQWKIDAGISSQYVSGLLFMLSIIGGTLELTGKVESAAYIDMTVKALKDFSADIKNDGRIYTVKNNPLCCPDGKMVTGGDWSNAAFFIVAGAIGKNPVTVDGLELSSVQGDKGIVGILESFGAKIEAQGRAVTAYPSELTATQVDAAQVPDLVPVVAVAASVAKGTTRIYGASRLRLKESDRLETVCNMLTAFGAKVEITEDGLLVQGVDCLTGGTADSAGDHRIAMSAAVASTVCKGSVEITGAQAVSKSYPAFWEDFEKMSEGA